MLRQLRCNTKRWDSKNSKIPRSRNYTERHVIQQADTRGREPELAAIYIHANFNMSCGFAGSSGVTRDVNDSCTIYLRGIFFFKGLEFATGNTNAGPLFFFDSTPSDGACPDSLKRPSRISLRGLPGRQGPISSKDGATKRLSL